MTDINERIATGLFGFCKSADCINGKKVKYRDKYGAPYFENDSCFPDYENDLKSACDILPFFGNFELYKHFNSSYTFRARKNLQGTIHEATSSVPSLAICTVALRVFGL